MINAKLFLRLLSILIIPKCGYCTVVATNSDYYYYAMAEEDNYSVLKHRSLFIRDNPELRRLKCIFGNFPIEYEYCIQNISLANTIKSPHSFILYKLPERADVKYIEKLQGQQKRYFQLNFTFYPEDSQWYEYPLYLIPNKKEASLYYSKYPNKDWDIFTNPKVNKISCQMFSYGGEYKIPVPAKKGKLIVDIFPDECLEDRNRNKYTLFVNFIPGRTYELKMIQDLIRSKKLGEPIFDISFLEMSQAQVNPNSLGNLEK